MMVFTLLSKVRKKILKSLARNFIWHPFRIYLLRKCNYKIGKDVYIGDDLIIIEELLDRDNVIIEDRVSIAPRLTIITSSHPNNSILRNNVPLKKGKVHIKQDAWIGCGVIIMPGITIGECSIIHAGSIVTEDIPPLSIASGIPAKVRGKVDIET
jgi:galactoside O-acetyltransferase